MLERFRVYCVFGEEASTPTLEALCAIIVISKEECGAKEKSDAQKWERVFECNLELLSYKR